ncbi:uncharacterized protein LTR77_008000 [Saxophila tyrrhenica]|uniref:BZIP domain-containing protein n=1 Tax=Saxophila tyrrhenica TaxID=1690608 RepID=A0AAV9P201_9PEZI|nr:hypothetical protein LTR77_008000 [Saxophila tyrrhenica]
MGPSDPNQFGMNGTGNNGSNHQQQQQQQEQPSFVMDDIDWNSLMEDMGVETPPTTPSEGQFPPSGSNQNSPAAPDNGQGQSTVSPAPGNGQGPSTSSPAPGEGQGQFNFSAAPGNGQGQFIGGPVVPDFPQAQREFEPYYHEPAGQVFAQDRVAGQSWASPSQVPGPFPQTPAGYPPGQLPLPQGIPSYPQDSPVWRPGQLYPSPDETDQDWYRQLSPLPSRTEPPSYTGYPGPSWTSSPESAPTDHQPTPTRTPIPRDPSRHPSTTTQPTGPMTQEVELPGKKRPGRRPQTEKGEGEPGSSDSRERRKQQNRDSQRKFRDKRAEKVGELTTEVAHLRAQLNASESRRLTAEAQAEQERQGRLAAEARVVEQAQALQQQADEMEELRRELEELRIKSKKDEK